MSKNSKYYSGLNVYECQAENALDGDPVNFRFYIYADDEDDVIMKSISLLPFWLRIGTITHVANI